MTSRPRTLVRGLVASAVLVALVLGIPLGLATQIGWPLPTSLPGWHGISEAIRTGRIDDLTIIKTLAVLLWLAWANFTAGLVIETAAVIRHRPSRAVRGLRPAQQVAANLLAAATLAFSALGRPTTADASSGHDLRLAVATATADDLRPSSTHQPPEPPVRTPPDEPGDAARYRAGGSPDRELYRVLPRDTLWDVADRLLGDPYRWREIRDLNVGRPQPDGRTLTRGSDEIHPGWLLALPPDAPASPEPAPSQQPTITVAPGDTLWDLADQHLDDPHRWTEIYAANRGQPQPDGRRLSDPDLIHPGWTLRLPDATATAADPPPATAQREPDPADPHGDSTTEPDAVAVAPEHDRPESTVPGTAEPSLEATEAPRTPTPAPSTAAPEPSAAAGDEQDRVDQPAERHDPGSIPLPSGALAGAALAAAIGSSLAAARLHRRRRRTLGDPHSGLAHDDALPTSARRLRRAQLDTLRHTEEGAHPAAATAGPPPPSLASYLLALGHRDGHQVTLDLRTISTLCLNGPTAADAARAIVLEYLGREPRDGTRHLILAAPELIPGSQALLATVACLDVAASLDDALTRAEVELIRRTRVLDEADADTHDAFTAANPGEPMPRLLIVAAVLDGHREARLEAIANLGHRVGLATLAIGHVPNWPTLTADEHGHVTDIPEHASLDHVRGTVLSTLTAEDAHDLAGIIAAAHGAHDDTADVPVLIEPAAPERPAVDRPAPGVEPVEVRLLGGIEILAAGEPVRTGLRAKARELLVYLLVHPRGARLDAAVDTLWPDVDRERGVQRFRTVLGNLRSTLRQATGLEDADFIDLAGDQRYQPDSALIGCDLWSLQDALQQAPLGSPDEKAASLEQVPSLYQGDLADGAFYEWIEPAREDLRRRAVDATARLAELRAQAGNLDGALAALEHAVRYDLYAEELYRRIITLQARLDRPDAARRTYRLLEARLADLDVDPEPATEELLRALTHSEV